MSKKIQKLKKSDPGYFQNYIDVKEQQEKKIRVSWFIDQKLFNKIHREMEKQEGRKDVSKAIETLIAKNNKV